MPAASSDRSTGALLVAGTTSDAGKSLLTAGICRWLHREGVRVAPFKAQNMALNAAVTPDGLELGRAQAVQAAACGLEPEALMNPVLLKPTGERTSQVVLLGRPYGTAGARDYRRLRAELRDAVLDSLATLRSRFDAVVCEGAGSPAEVNLREGDFVNMGLARAAGLPAIVVGDIDRGGVLAAHYGTIALLEPADQAHIAGTVINKFRGDPGLLEPGVRRLEELTGRPVLGVVPWADGLELDAEDGLALRSFDRGASTADPLRVAVVGLRRISNFTDLDALAIEPDVDLRLTRDPDAIRDADLVVLPGSKATVDDLADLRAAGLDRALAERVAAGRPVLGVCGGYQMLGAAIEDAGVETGTGTVPGLGLLPVRTTMHAEKITRRRTGALALDDAGGLTGARAGAAAAARGDAGLAGTAPTTQDGAGLAGAAPPREPGDGAPGPTAPRGMRNGAGAVPAGGYEIRHGRVVRHGGAPLVVGDPVALAAEEAPGDVRDEGCVVGVVAGTSWHGLLEHDEARHALLRWAAAHRGRPFAPGTARFADVRERRLDQLGDLVAEHLDTAALRRLLDEGVPPGLPTLACGPLTQGRSPEGVGS
ncbi:cobyric acid synthase [Patulibacter brassicae]|uniref:Cobyric acid synthase n=1 Tax=Patulibacter brassicae TaxID=1705717 RepID=A0ABU4VKV7_9ACTN|nr:cobyric acid synthase [Patulibacter brassicae]MDX8151488.1 cobyric acid synthase [Patulibacter brassicae]